MNPRPVFYCLAGLRTPGSKNQRIAQPEDVAAVIAFLLSKDASYVNGTIIPVDAGTVAAYVPRPEHPCLAQSGAKPPCDPSCDYRDWIFPKVELDLLHMFTLYFAPHTCSLASHIALLDGGAKYDLKRIDFAKTEQQSPDYLEVNPKGRVPAMVTPQGILTETPAILAFIAQSFPHACLAPLDDPFAFAELQAFNNYLCATLHVAHAHRMRGHRWADEVSSFTDMQRKVPRSVGACYELIETRMLKGPWVMGSTYSIADPYLFTLAQWLEDDGVDAARIPRVMEHRARMSQRPNVGRAIAEELAD